MVKSRGGAATRRFMQDLPGLLRQRVLPGAARAGGRVIAGEAKHLLGDRHAEGPGGTLVLIADSVKLRVRSREGTVRARVLLKGPGAYVGRWLEYGTTPHFISVDPEFRGGMTARRINHRIADGDSDLKATLIINGKPVGTSVHHPGARRFPFMRPAGDTKAADAIAAAQSYIDAHVTRRGIVAAAEPEGNEA